MLFDTSQYLSSSALMTEDNEFDEGNFVGKKNFFIMDNIEPYTEKNNFPPTNH